MQSHKKYADDKLYYWVYAVLDEYKPKKSTVVFGVTKFAEITPKVHAYARGKGDYLESAVKLLRASVVSDTSSHDGAKQPAVAPIEIDSD